MAQRRAWSILLVAASVIASALLGAQASWAATDSSMTSASSGDESATASAAAGVSVTVTPAEITLTPGATSRVAVALTNGSDKPVATSVRALTSDSSLQVDHDGADATATPATAVVAAGATTVLEFSVSREAEGTGQALSVQFLATSSVGTGSDTTVAVGTLSVKVAVTNELLKAEFKSDVKKVNEYRPADTALVLTNARSDVISITSLLLRVPRQVNVTVTCVDSATNDNSDDSGGSADGDNGAVNRTYDGDDDGLDVPVADCVGDLAPRSQTVLPLLVEVGDSLTPGPRTLTVILEGAVGPSSETGSDDSTGDNNAAPGTSASTRTGTEPGTGDVASLVVTDDFDVEVFAESDILSAIGVPIFLLLPGAIIVLTSILLVSKLTGWRRALSGLPELSYKSVSVAVLFSLAVSLGFAKAYPHLTDVYPGTSRDYLRAQGFDDFYWVILWSFLISLAVWAIAALVFWVTRHWLVYEAGDDERDILRKVRAKSHFGRPVQFHLVNIEGAKKGLRIRGPNASGHDLLSPRIGYALPANTSAEARARVIQQSESYRASSDSDSFRPSTFRNLVDALNDAHANYAYLPGDIATPSEAEHIKVSLLGDDLRDLLVKLPELDAVPPPPAAARAAPSNEP